MTSALVSLLVVVREDDVSKKGWHSPPLIISLPLKEASVSAEQSAVCVGSPYSFATKVSLDCRIRGRSVGLYECEEQARKCR